MIKLNNICKTFENNGAEKIILDNVTFSINTEKFSCIIGNNGQGKTTLAKMLAGIEKVDSGSIESNNLNIVYFNQDSINDINKYETVLDYLLSYHENYWEIEIILKDIFSFTLEYNKKSKDFSQGQKQLICLITKLSNTSNFVILDEPTNHLDMETINKLIDYLKEYKEKLGKGCILISHDLELINNLSEVLIEIHDAGVKIYTGNYVDFVEENKNLEKIRQVKLKKLKNDLKDNKIEINQQLNSDPQKNYKAPDKDRQVKSYKIASAYTTIAKKVNRLKHDIGNTEEEIVALSKPKNHLARFGITETESSKFFISKIEEGKISLIDINKKEQPAHNFLQDINISLYNGQKISLQGKNGSGKTVLINTLLKSYSNDELRLISKDHKIKEDLKVGYFNQNYLNQLDITKTVIENFRWLHPSLSEVDTRKSLSNMLFFTTTDINKKVVQLSGGEKVRIALAMITAIPIDVLILDEPDNNLDIQTKQVLIEAINNYQNAVILITHDKHFLSKVNIDITWVIKNGFIRVWK